MSHRHCHSHVENKYMISLLPGSKSGSSKNRSAVWRRKRVAVACKLRAVHHVRRLRCERRGGKCPECVLRGRGARELAWAGHILRGQARALHPSMLLRELQMLLLLVVLLQLQLVLLQLLASLLLLVLQLVLLQLLALLLLLVLLLLLLQLLVQILQLELLHVCRLRLSLRLLLLLQELLLVLALHFRDCGLRRERRRHALRYERRSC